MKKSFLLYADYAEKFKSLSDFQLGKLFREILRYESTGETVRIDDPMVQFAFDVIRSDLDRNSEKYEEVKEKRKEAGRRGGLAKASNAKQNLANVANAKFAKQNLANVAVNVNDNVNDNVNVNVNNIKDIDGGEAEQNPAKIKHKRGQYNHVLISDEEVEKLDRDYGNAEELIAYLDEYIEYKGYKAKNHYLAIRKWVVDAVKEKRNRSSPRNSSFNATQYILDGLKGGRFDDQ